MKANLKGTGGIKGLLLLHGEKIGMAIVGLCAAMFLYYSLQQQHLPDKLQAEELQKQIRETKAAFENSKWPEPGSELAEKVRVSRPISAIGEKDVLPETYKTSPLGWDSPVITPTVPRTDPNMLAAIDVRATGGCGLFAFLDEQVRKERALALEAQADKKQKEEEKKRLKELNSQGNEGNAPKRGRDGEEPGREVVDPEHPNRRLVEGNLHTAGASLQGDERVERVYWAAVVAKVPIKEQLKLYRDAFENSRGGFDPTFDFPTYIGFIVQRAEVVRGQEPKWEKVEVYDGQGKKIGPFIARPILDKLFLAIAKDWAPPQPEVVDDRYLDFSGLLTYPLPPLVGRDWGSEATHPDIPLAVNAPPPEEETIPAEQPTEKPASTDETDVFSATSGPNTEIMARPGAPMGGPRGMAPRGGGSFFPGGERGAMMPGGERGGPSAFGGERGGGPRGPAAYSMTRGGGAGGQRTTLPRGVDSWLLRFFDFTVEPGKKYRYQVRLVLNDPNNQPGRLEESVLDSKVLARQRESAKARKDNKPSPILYTDWSEPSPPVGIPLGGGTRLAEAKATTGKSFNEEPSVKLLVESFDQDKGNWIQASKEFEFRRGAVANLVSKAEYLVEGGRAIDPKEDFKFNTGITVLDVDGGEKLSKDVQVPSRVLLMDATGQLFVRTELDDSSVVEEHRAIFAEPDKKKGRRGEGGPEMPGRGERGPAPMSRGERG